MRVKQNTFASMTVRKIKIGAIRNLTDARNAAALGVDFLGLLMDPRHPEAMSPVNVPDLKKWIEGPEIIAELGEMPQEKAIKLIELLDLKYYQLQSGVQLHENAGLWIDARNGTMPESKAAGIIVSSLDRPETYFNCSVKDDFGKIPVSQNINIDLNPSDQIDWEELESKIRALPS